MHGDPPFSVWILTALGTSNKSHMETNKKKYLPIRATVLNRRQKSLASQLVILIIYLSLYLSFVIPLESEKNCRPQADRRSKCSSTKTNKIIEFRLESY